MTARFRIVVAVAILVVLAAHPLAHPLLKECPCVHQSATAAVERADSFVHLLLAGRTAPAVEHVAEAPQIRVRAARAPPVA